MAGHQVLFVAGLGRSGTTALFNVLSDHPRIVLGLERYKRLYLRQDVVLGPDLFTEDRFFDFSDGATNVTPDARKAWATHYAKMRERWSSATYVGDKLVTIRARRIWDTLPDARFVFIVRDIHDVAASWEARAHDPDDTEWPADRGARRAVAGWNKAARRVRRAVRQRPDHAVVVEHARFFADPSGESLAATLSWLGLQRGPEVDQQFARVHHQFVTKVAPKGRRLAAEDQTYVDEHMDAQCWRELVAMAL